MILKLSSSGRQLQVVTDDGLVFGTSVDFVKGLFVGRAPFVLMTRLPFKVSKGRYKPSPVWNPETGEKEYSSLDVLEPESVSLDAHSKKVTDRAKKVKAFGREVKL